MSKVSIYFNFARNTEEAFTYYKSIFGGEFVGGIHRLGEAPRGERQPPLSEEDKNLVLHVVLPILGGLNLMGTDAPESMGFTVNYGNNIYINLEPDTRAELNKLFAGLSEGGIVETSPCVMFWGDYYAACKDKFGVQWMFNCSEK